MRDQKQPPAQTLFLGNLGFETTEKSIRELFEAHKVKPKKKKEVEEAPEENVEKEGKEAGKVTGKEAVEEDKGVGIRKVRLGTFEDTGACKG